MKSLIDAVTATKTRTKSTPNALREIVNALLRLKRLRLRSAILNRLRMSSLAAHELAFFQRTNDFGLADDPRVVGRKDESRVEIIPHLFHEPDDRIGSLMV